MPKSQKARAIYDYDARASDELTFKRNDLIEVLGVDDEDEGWYKGRLNGVEGLFPNNYVHFIEETPPAAAPPKPAPSAPAAPTPPPTAPTTLPTAPASGLPEYVKQQKFEGSYALAEVLGRGRFSQVRRCTHTASGRSCAVKIMELDDPELGANPQDAEKEILAEVKVLRMVEHASIVELLETIKDGGRYHLVLEDLNGGDLFDRIEQNGPYKEEDAALLLRQVVTAVDYLHAKGIVHRDVRAPGAARPPSRPPTHAARPPRPSACAPTPHSAAAGGGHPSAAPRTHARAASRLARPATSLTRGAVRRRTTPAQLKPDNLVFTTKAPDARIKIIDFGYAGFCSASAPLRGLCGTPDYAAPEILTWCDPGPSTGSCMLPSCCPSSDCR